MKSLRSDLLQSGGIKMSEEEKKVADETLLKFYDKILEVIEILKPLNQKQLNYLKLQYDIVHKKVQLNDLVKKSGENND